MREGLSLFTPPAEQVARVRSWSRERQWGYTEAELEHALHTLPIVGSEVSDTVLALVPYPSDQEVYHVNSRKAAEAQTTRGADLWKLAARPFARHDPWPTMKGSECWTIGQHPFHTGLRWEVLRLRVSVVSSDIREALRLLAPERALFPPRAVELLPHLGVIAALALHPAWVASIAGGTSPNVLVPGYGFHLPVHPLASTRHWSFLCVGMAGDRLTRRMVRLDDYLLQDKTAIPELVTV